jgi:hypothetical protein
MSLFTERVGEIVKNAKRVISGVEVVKNEAGVARFERGRTYFQGNVGGVPVIVEVKKGRFDITVSKPTGDVFSDGSPVTERPVRVSGHRNWGKDIPADLHETTFF